MISSSKKKRGRPTAIYRMANGTPVPGLLRRADGRWKISATGQTFVERDESLAVDRFAEITGWDRDKKLGQLSVHPNAIAAMKDIAKRTIAAGGTLTIETERLGDGYAVRDVTLSREQWSWLRHKILTEGKWVAQQVGIEQIGWLSDVKPPAVSPKLDELIDLYTAKTGLSTNEAGRSRLFWKEFSRAVSIEQIGDLTHDHVAAYEQAIATGKYAPKSVLHRYRKIRTVLAYAIKRGKGTEDCRRALDITAMLEVKNHTPLDPRPIRPTDFWAIHREAIKAGDQTFAAMILTALNMAAYAGEAAALRWDEVDLKTGELVSRRSKTGVSRVAMLWPEVVTALKALPRSGDYIFNTRVRSYTVYSALECWRRYRKAAGLGEDIVFGMIRDAGFTIACRVSLDQARVLAGHRLPGASDHYVRRNPGFVADACQAINQAFYSADAGAKRKRRSI